MSRNIRKQLKEEDMEKAIMAVRKEKMETLKAAKFFKVPRTTLQTLAKRFTLPQNKQQQQN
jgi:transcriptional regulator with GAF, ATPase, and Fis domain